MSAPALKRFRVVVIEWMTHKAFIEAPDGRLRRGGGKTAVGREAGDQPFGFEDSGIDGIQVEEIAP